MIPWPQPAQHVTRFMLLSATFRIQDRHCCSRSLRGRYEGARTLAAGALVPEIVACAIQRSAIVYGLFAIDWTPAIAQALAMPRGGYPLELGFVDSRGARVATASVALVVSPLWNHPPAIPEGEPPC